MDSAEVAQQLGITSKELRKFLRSNASTFQAVGSGGRYTFDAEDLPTLRTRFSEWKGGKTTATKSTPRNTGTTRVARQRTQRDRDREVWAEEGTIQLPDIRDPRVLARVRADARAAEDRLEASLLAAGLHITQRRG